MLFICLFGTKLITICLRPLCCCTIFALTNGNGMYHHGIQWQYCGCLMHTVDLNSEYYIYISCYMVILRYYGAKMLHLKKTNVVLQWYNFCLVLNYRTNTNWTDYRIVILVNIKCWHYSSESVLEGDAVGKGRWVFMELHEAESASSSSVSAFFI